MSQRREVVITGLGVVSPIGVGRNAFWSALVDGRSGIAEISGFDASAMPVRIAAEVRHFDPKQFVTPRKSLKVMARDSVLAVAAAKLACEDAALKPGTVDPDRFGVVLGADRLRNELEEVREAFHQSVDPQGNFQIGLFATAGASKYYPLGFLKVLPNMLASHISILHDARGPNNTLHQAELSSLLAVGEAARVIERGAADCMLTGAASSRMHPLDWVRSCLSDVLSRRTADPALASRPFDALRDGQVRGEGAAVFVLESRDHARARGAPILARVLSSASSCSVHPDGTPHHALALQRAIHRALAEAQLEPAQLGHVNAHGLSTIADDATEAQTLARLLPNTPVTALKSYFGNLFAAGGAVEMAGSLLGLLARQVPYTLNYEHPDQSCPVSLVTRQPLTGRPPTALLVNQTAIGQVAALVLAAVDA